MDFRSTLLSFVAFVSLAIVPIAGFAQDEETGYVGFGVGSCA